MMTNSVDPDQTLQNAASDLGLHCLLRPVPVFWVITRLNLSSGYSNRFTIFIVSIGIPKLLTILILKFEKVY